MKMLIVTGLSGAGKTTVLNIMEDAGYETVDSIPLSILPLLLSSDHSADDRMIVVGVDIRSRDFSAEQLEQVLHDIEESGRHEVRILFMDCDDDMLQRRYTETRRRHPLAKDKPVLTGIQQERELLQPILTRADEVINTSDLKTADLKQVVFQRFVEAPAALSIAVQSFSYKRGVPREADLVFDVRFLRNPYYLPELRDMSGLDAAVGDYVKDDPSFKDFFTRLTGMLLPLLPRYREEGKNYLTVAIGCTGGQHRSVYVAQKLADYLLNNEYSVSCKHREIELYKNP